MDFTRITINPAQMGGAPCIRGLRIPVTTVVGLVEAGMIPEQILESYPSLEKEDIAEALRFVAQAPSNDPVFVAEDLIPRLMAEFNYALDEARKRADELVACQPLTKAAFWHWWTTGSDLPLQINGLTKDLFMQVGNNPIIAFLNMDYLERHPETTAQDMARYFFEDLEELPELESPLREPDPIAQLRAICMALPEATEGARVGNPAWRVREKIFAMQHGFEGRPSMWCKAPQGVQRMLVQSNPARFFVPPYVGQHGWVGVRLDGPLDWDEITDLVTDSYRMTAPKRLREQIRA